MCFGIWQGKTVLSSWVFQHVASRLWPPLLTLLDPPKSSLFPAPILSSAFLSCFVVSLPLEIFPSGSKMMLPCLLAIALEMQLLSV